MSADGEHDADLAERLRRCQAGLVEAVRAREAAEEERDRAVAARDRETARREKVEARLAHVAERAERLEGLVDSIRSSQAWKAVEAYRSAMSRLRS